MSLSAAASTQSLLPPLSLALLALLPLVARSAPQQQQQQSSGDEAEAFEDPEISLSESPLPLASK